MDSLRTVRMLAPNDGFLRAQRLAEKQTPPSESPEALVKRVEEGDCVTRPDHQCNPIGTEPDRRSIVSDATRQLLAKRLGLAHQLRTLAEKPRNCVGIAL